MNARQTLVDRRIRLLLSVLVVAFAASLGRAVWLQGVRAEPLSRLAQVQHREQVSVPARRGTIFDRTGMLLAIGERATTVYADPRRILDPREAARTAGLALDKDPDELVGELADRSRAFVYVERKADPDRAALLARKSVPGLGFYPEERRVYPQRTVGAHVLGYAGVDNRGLAGIERSLDRLLAGKAGSHTVVKAADGRPVDVVNERAARDGTDLYLTLDQNMQANAESVLRTTVERWRARSASAIVLDPKTGEMLAMAVAPSFDANRFAETSPDLSRNRTVTDTYEPGSTFKLITVAAALSEGLVSPLTAYTLPPEIQVADRTIHESHSRPARRMTVTQILSQSSNVGTVTLAQIVGSRKLARWIGRFGFGRRAGIDFPGESAGIVYPVDKWSGSTIGNVPLGQGIAVTPVQMAAAYATVANDGVWVQPHLVARVGGEPKVRPKRRRVVSAGVARTLVAMLRGVVDEGGTGAAAAVAGYHVAGKTGTAAKPDERGGYSTSRYVASFVGMVPATSPRLVILVTVDEPRGTIWGGIVAAPAFQEIARFALQYLGIPPDAPVPAPQSRSEG